MAREMKSIKFKVIWSIWGRAFFWAHYAYCWTVAPFYKDDDAYQSLCERCADRCARWIDVRVI